jgi:hypothetical protein
MNKARYADITHLPRPAANNDLTAQLVHQRFGDPSPAQPRGASDRKSADQERGGAAEVARRGLPQKDRNRKQVISLVKQNRAKKGAELLVRGGAVPMNDATIRKMHEKNEPSRAALSMEIPPPPPRLSEGHSD